MLKRSLVAASVLLWITSAAFADEPYREERRLDRERAHHFISGRVVSVEDGDTCVVQDRDGRKHRVCLYGIDAPERGQAYWTNARESLARKIADREVRFESVETDREGRPLCNMYLGDRHVNLEQVREGYGWHNTGHEPIREFAAAERDAREHHRGLWHDREPVQPWKYRAEHREARFDRERERRD